VAPPQAFEPVPGGAKVRCQPPPLPHLVPFLVSIPGAIEENLGARPWMDGNTAAAILRGPNENRVPCASPCAQPNQASPHRDTCDFSANNRSPRRVRGRFTTARPLNGPTQMGKPFAESDHPSRSRETGPPLTPLPLKPTWWETVKKNLPLLIIPGKTPPL